MHCDKIIPLKAILVVFAIILLLGGIIIFYTYNPAVSSFFPKCPFYYITGYKCPGCGSQRALHQLLHLRFSEAFRYNALFIISIPFVMFLCIADIMRLKYKKLYIASRNPFLSWGILFIICLWWICRNILGI